MNEKIDFVVTWIDGSDPNWIAEKNKYFIGNDEDASTNRYKDWGLLKYWFRGVEKFAPWVNKIYFITYGHLPTWLNVDNPKLVIVKHSDYIPKQYLPTFNSNVIELNIGKIKELSNNFVLFNDDFFLIKRTKPTDFFKNNVPCDTIGLNVHCPDEKNIVQNICIRDTEIINKYFNIHDVLKKDWKKWYNIKNGKILLRTLALQSCPRFPGFWQSHLPISYKKQTFEKIWNIEGKLLNETSTHKFRSKEDINHWLMREFQICEGNINVRNIKFGKVFHIEEFCQKDINEILCTIRKQKYKCICINDSKYTNNNYSKLVEKIKNEFNNILPQKSSFEK